MTARFKGPHTADARARMSASHKARLDKPEEKAKHVAMVRAAFARPDVRANISAAQKLSAAKPERLEHLRRIGVIGRAVRAQNKKKNKRAYPIELEGLYHKLRKSGLSRADAIAECNRPAKQEAICPC